MLNKMAAMTLLMGFLCTLNPARCQSPGTNLLADLLEQGPKSLTKVLKKDRYEVEIIYTQIDRDQENEPTFTQYSYNGDSDRYFYPASTVKMPVAFLALEKLNELGLARQLFMLTDSAWSGQTTVYTDPSSASGMPAVDHYIRKIFLVSDNDAYNRLYEFLGQEYILDKLNEKGYVNTRIIHRLSIPLTEAENRHTNPVRFQDGTGREIYNQPMQVNQGDLNLRGSITKGKGYIRNGELIKNPMDFSLKNYLPLDEMHLMLRAVLFPEFSPEKSRFTLSEEQYQFLYKYMSQLPGETRYPAYDQDEYYDAYCKFLLYGSDKNITIPGHIRIFNKIGQAYGYVIDNAYIVDIENKVEFLLSAVIHTNKNRIYNDGEYEYEETAFPFMKDLGRLIYEYELSRKREFSPDLSRFTLAYDSNKN